MKIIATDKHTVQCITVFEVGNNNNVIYGNANHIVGVNRKYNFL